MAHVTGAADPVFAGRMADFLLTLSLVDALVQEWPQLVEDRRLPLERAANMSLEELPDAGWGVVHSLAEYAVKREMTPRGATHIRGMRDIIHACALTVREARAHPAWEEFLAAFNHSHRNTAAEYSDFQMECASRAPAAAPAYLADSYALDNKDVDWLLASLQALDSHPRLNSIIQGAKLCKGR